VFELIAADGAARRGRLTTAHGSVETPVFMPIGTQASVKSLSPDDLRDAGAEIVLGNTYHLMLRPGEAIVRDLGGLHRFMSWDRAILTDSGGFQVFSLSKLTRVTDEGATFRSPIDGAEHRLSPERSIEIQHALGADIIVALDEFLAPPAAHADIERSLAMTLRWAQRSKAAHVRYREGDAAPPGRRALFGIVQGGAYADLRTRAADATVEIGFDGYAIGGMAVGEPKPLMYDLIELTAARLPATQARYVMGVGKPDDLVEAVARGVDMFDCVLPTRNARNGQCFTATGPLAIKQARFARDPGPIEDGCDCYTCARFSRAYLRHLYLAKELLVYRLLTLHNVRYFIRLMEQMRSAIAVHEFAAFRARFFSAYAVSSTPDRTSEVDRSPTGRPEVQ
jgi:queuine tRNA-ribosyltransferase